MGYDLTPDGGTLVFDGHMEEGGDGRYRESHIYAMDLGTGEIRQLTRERGPWASPKVSPDGRRIAFTGYPWTSQTYKTTDLYVMNRDGSDPARISGSLDRDVGSPQLVVGFRRCLLHGRRSRHHERPLRLRGGATFGR